MTQAQIPSPEDLAQKVAKEFGEGVQSARDDGWTITIKKSSSRNIVVRSMERGGVRDEPYFRVGVSGKNSLTLDGKYSEETDPFLLAGPMKPGAHPRYYKDGYLAGLREALEIIAKHAERPATYNVEQREHEHIVAENKDETYRGDRGDGTSDRQS